jgi:ATP-binding cassette subfamily F protein uup
MTFHLTLDGARAISPQRHCNILNFAHFLAMNILSVEELSKAFGPKVLFKGISFGISKGQKMALVAKNGTGKTTLMNILFGKDTPDKGSVVFRKDQRVTYLEQDPRLDETKNVLQVVFEGNTPELNAIRDYEHFLILYEKDPTEKNLDSMMNAQGRIEELNCWEYESKAKQILAQLGIHDFEQQVNQLSGGQVKRVALAKVLIQVPDLLILDEPTNHLDMEMVEWLEEYFEQQQDMALLMVTHDRYFLDRVCDEILELDGGELHRYKGNYSYYVERKAEREQIAASETDKVRNLYRRELEWVLKMPKARTVKSKSRVDAFDDVKEKALKKKVKERLEFSVKVTRLGGKILELVKLGKSFGDKKILNDFSYVFKSKEKIGIIGRNGSGKSTFLNMLLGLEPYDKGKIQTGETVVFGYYSQAGIKLNGDKRVIEVVKDIAEYIPLANGSQLSASQLLQRFLFSPEMQYTYVSKLSGGERRRLYLCTVLIRNPNFLVLDEPTNDLDIVTLSTLEDFLADFQGCVLIVSHDSYFMDRLVDHLFVFEGDGEIKDFPGNYSEYREWKLIQEREEKEVMKQPVKPVEEKIAQEHSGKRKPTFGEKREYEQLDKEIPAMERRKKELEEQMNAGIDDFSKLQTVTDEYNKISAELEGKTLRWMELAEIVGQ